MPLLKRVHLLSVRTETPEGGVVVRADSKLRAVKFQVMKSVEEAKGTKQ